MRFQRTPSKLKEYSKDLNWNLWNQWTFNPASQMVVRGNQESLSQKDLWNLPTEFQAEVNIPFLPSFLYLFVP